MKYVMMFALLVGVSGCDTLREGFNFHTIGTMLDGNACMWQSKVTAEKDAIATAGLLTGPNDFERQRELLELVHNTLADGQALCKANRKQEGYLHERSIREGQYR